MTDTTPPLSDDSPLARYILFGTFTFLGLCMLMKPVMELYGILTLWASFGLFFYYMMFDRKTLTEIQQKDLVGMVIAISMALMLISSTMVSKKIINMLYHLRHEMPSRQLKAYREFKIIWIVTLFLLVALVLWYVKYHTELGFYTVIKGPVLNDVFPSVVMSLGVWGIKVTMTVLILLGSGYTVYEANKLY